MIKRLKIFLEMIKFEHTIFALPFAYLGYLLASRGQIDVAELAWVTIAMIAARTAGMGLNRLIDRQIDAKNPRTSQRALVTGEISTLTTWGIVFFCLPLLLLSAWKLNPLCLKLSPIAVILLFAYHYLKRITWLCHLGIGLVLASAPVGGWLAATGVWQGEAAYLAFAVLFWVAGFDIFYSLQDIDFDREQGLFSVPARFGENRALQIAGLFHFLTMIFLITLGILMHLSFYYWLGLAFVSGILAFEHHLIHCDRKRYVNLAFFTMNGILSTLFFVATTMSLYL